MKLSKDVIRLICHMSAKHHTGMLESIRLTCTWLLNDCQIAKLWNEKSTNASRFTELKKLVCSHYKSDAFTLCVCREIEPNYFETIIGVTCVLEWYTRKCVAYNKRGKRVWQIKTDNVLGVPIVSMDKEDDTWIYKHSDIWLIQEEGPRRYQIILYVE